MAARLFGDGANDHSRDSWCVCWAAFSGPLAHACRSVHSNSILIV